MTQSETIINAIDDFIVGCKTDGTWNAIKTARILAGWDRLDAAGTAQIGTGIPDLHWFSQEPDPYYNSVVLLMPLTGTNGSTTFTDYAPSPATAFSRSTCVISTSDSVFNGSALYSNTTTGTSSYLRVTTNSKLHFGTNDFTIEFWVKIISNAAQYPYILSTSNYTTNGFYIICTGGNTGWGGQGRLTFASAQLTGGPALVSTTVIRNSGKWHHVAIVRNGDDFAMFIDGKMEAQTTNSTANYAGSTYTAIFAPLDAAGNISTGGSDLGRMCGLRVTVGVARYTSNFTPLRLAPPVNGIDVIDYDRFLGPTADGTRKYIDSKRSNSADPQDSNHNAVYASRIGSVYGVLMGAEGTPATNTNHMGGGWVKPLYSQCRTSTTQYSVNPPAQGLVGFSRSSASSYTVRNNGADEIVNVSSAAPVDSLNVWIFSRLYSIIPSAHRIPFYSIGESLDLSQLDSRVSTLMNTIGSFSTVTYDSDAATYINAVETADGQSLEDSVKVAINDFIIELKTFGLWSTIKASCILAGARTLNGALTPLKGTAPTNFNFVAGDYSRTTGLVGDGSTKYLDSNRNNSSDPQNNHHMGLYVSTHPTVGFGIAGAGAGETGTTALLVSGNTMQSRNRSSSASSGIAFSTGFTGMSRSASSSYTEIRAGLENTVYIASQIPYAFSSYIFALNQGGALSGTTNARLAFYSIGESLDLEKLDRIVTRFMADLALAIATS